MIFQILLLSQFAFYAFSRHITHRQPNLLKVTLYQNGQTAQKILLDNFSKNNTISFKIQDQERQMLQNQLKNLKKLDTLQILYEIDYIPLKNFYNAQYFGKIKIGSQKQEFNVLFDTGSAYTWVAGQDCEGCRKSGIKEIFQDQKSTSCSYLNKQVKMQYGTGKLTGQIIEESLIIGNLIAFNQTMLLVINLSELDHFEGDGLVGLGFDTLSDGYPTIIDTLVNQHQIKNKEFSIYLTDTELDKSELIIGGIDIKYASNEDQWHYCEVVNNKYWAVQGYSVSFVSKDGFIRRSLNGIQAVHHNEINDEKSTLLLSSLFVIDSGTSVIVLNQVDFDHLISYLEDFNIYCQASIKFDGIYECDKKNIIHFPNLEVNLCGKVFTINSSKFLMCDWSKCYLLITPIEIPVIILGDLFMREYYTHFIQDSPRKIGFIKSK